MNDAQVIELTSLQCTAHSKSTGLQCGQRAIPGGRVCRYHGGAAPQVQAAAAERIELARDTALNKLIARLAIVDDFGPDGEFMGVETKTLLDIVVKLTEKHQLLTGQATSRDESVKTSVALERLEVRLSQLGPRVEALVAGGAGEDGVIDV